MSTTAGAREVRAPRGTELTCKGWPQEAALRMLMNNLDPEVAERPDRSGRLRRHRPSGAFLGGIRRDRARAPPSRGRRDPADPVGQAGRRGPDARVGAARADREQQPRPRVGDVGGVPQARGARAHDVRPDDRGVVDLHRHAGHLAGHVRDVRGDRRQARRHARRDDLAHGRARRDGRRTAARGHDERRRGPVRRRRPHPDRAAGQDALPRRVGRRRRRGASDGGRRPRPPRAAVDRRRRQRGRRRAATRGERRTDRHRDRPDERARSAELRPAGAVSRGRRRPARVGRRRVHEARAGVDGRALRRDGGVPRRRRRGVRLREQPARRGRARRVRPRVRVPGVHPGLHPAAVLRGQGPVPVGGAVGRSGRHRGDRPRGARGVPRERGARALDPDGGRAGRLSRACPRGSAGSGTGSGTASGCGSTTWSRAGSCRRRS